MNISDIGNKVRLIDQIIMVCTRQDCGCVFTSYSLFFEIEKNTENKEGLLGVCVPE